MPNVKKNIKLFLFFNVFAFFEDFLIYFQERPDAETSLKKVAKLSENTKVFLTLHRKITIKMTEADIIIIGGGAAGLMAAFGVCRKTFEGQKQEQKDKGKKRSGRKDTRVLVLEKMNRPGRKIMLTGKGRCNFTNAKQWGDFAEHVHPKANFLKPAFYCLNPEMLIRTFEEHGLKSIVERGDRVFPVSHKAMDVVDTLTYMASSAGAEIICGKEVCEIERTRIMYGNAGIGGRIQSDNLKTEQLPEEADNGCFRLRCTDGSDYSCRKLIVTTGGLSYPTTGSTGDGYGWAQKFGHDIKECFPSLTAIVPKGYKEDDKEKQFNVEEHSRFIDTGHNSNKAGIGHIDRVTPMTELGKSLCGTSLKNVNICLIVNGNTIQEEFGDLDFTDGGLEGPIGFRISRNCVNAIMKKAKVFVSVDLKPAVELTTLKLRIDGLWKEISKDRRSKWLTYKDKVQVLLEKVMPKSIIPAFIYFNPTIDHKILADRLKNWKIEVVGYVGYERCVITAGGIATESIIAKSLESKVCKHLYFAGEVLDIDADTGGYNMHIAFATGYLAGISAASE